MSGSSRAAVLVLNCGSSSVKSALIDPETGERHITALAERVGTPELTIEVRAGDEDLPVGRIVGTDHAAVIRKIMRAAQTWNTAHGVEIEAVGHRMVHGGEEFASSVLLDEDSLAAVERCTPLAPLHNPANLTGVAAAREVLSDVPHIGVFDTAFHQTMPPVAYRYAVPPEWYTEHRVRRFGFHGTSHRYVSGKAADMLRRPLAELRMVTAHLGNGCSLTAIRDGVCVDTSMGLTPLEGVVMGTRSGDLDPGIPAYIHERTGADIEQITSDLNHRSGLLALSGLSNDMRELMEAVRAKHEGAVLALDVFCYRIAKYVASLVVPLGGLDVLVFTGGIGEHSYEMRAGIINQLGFLGLQLDPAANKTTVGGKAGLVTVIPSPVPGSGRGARPGPVALVVPTDEELVIARDSHRIARRRPAVRRPDPPSESADGERNESERNESERNESARNDATADSAQPQSAPGEGGSR